ncbi:MAG: hypothetical protein ABI690_21935 [Chloroflexota bacterium]
MKRCIIGMTLMILFLSSLPVHGQEDVNANFTAELGAPLIGQPIDLLLTVNAPADATVTLPTFASDWPPFAIHQIGAVTQSTNVGRTTYQQHLSVILWRPGDYQTPPTQIGYQLANATALQQVDIQPAYFAVKTVLNPDDLNLRPLKPPVSMFYISPLYVALAALNLVLAGIYVRSKRKKFLLPTVSDTNTLHAAARAALAEFKKVHNANPVPAVVYENVSSALRRYLQGRFAVSAEELTTQELMSDLVNLQTLSDRRKRELEYLLEQADLVKFARMQPKSADKILNVAQQWVTAVEQDQAGVEK